jgi:hypothetical protein
VVDPTLEALWQKVLGAWHDDAAHAIFLASCRQSGQLGYAAECYREEARRKTVYREDGQRSDLAEQKLRTITALAMLDLIANRTQRASTPRQIAQKLARWGLVLMFVCSLAYAALTLLTR